MTNERVAVRKPASRQWWSRSSACRRDRTGLGVLGADEAQGPDRVPLLAVTALGIAALDDPSYGESRAAGDRGEAFVWDPRTSADHGLAVAGLDEGHLGRCDHDVSLGAAEIEAVQLGERSQSK